MGEQILIAEDDADINNLLAKILRTEHFKPIQAFSGTEAKLLFMHNTPDLILLDLMLPGLSGEELLSELRENLSSDVPVIILSAKIALADKVSLLKMGADDYITKPFTPMELLARVNSHLRRYNRFMALLNRKEEKDGGENSNIYRIGGLELNEDTVELMVDGEPAKLTPMEFKILSLLMKNPGHVFSADDIYERVWNERAINTDTVMVHVRNIREKIELDPKKPKYLKVVWGVGYKIEKLP